MSLRKILVLDGVTAVCRFRDDGAVMEARGWEAVTGQGGFQPLQGFSVVGLEWSVVVNGNCGVIVKNRDADYEAAFNALKPA